MNAGEVNAYLARSAAERVISVDADDHPLAEVSRGQAQRDGLITRCTYVFVFNSSGQLCMHRRTLHKRLYPGYWDVCAGGLVAAGESYAEGAARELEEELGVVGVALQGHGRFYFDSPESRLWGGVFSCIWDGPIRMQPEEVLAVRWVDPQAHWQRAGEQYTPDSMQALQAWRSGNLKDFAG